MVCLRPKQFRDVFSSLCVVFGTGIYELQSGMLVEILKESTKKKAKSPKAGDSCKVTYSGTLKDGTPFDSGTTSFAPNQVIKGWTEGNFDSSFTSKEISSLMQFISCSNATHGRR